MEVRQMDFDAFMAICSANYQRMHRLLSTPHQAGDILTSQIGTYGQLQMCFMEKQNYTDIVTIIYQTAQSSSWLPNIDIQVRLYHDAQLAEVSAAKDYQGKMQQFSHPASKEQFPYWEKWQINALLSDILSSCLKQRATFTITPNRI